LEEGAINPGQRAHASLVFYRNASYRLMMCRASIFFLACARSHHNAYLPSYPAGILLSDAVTMGVPDWQQTVGRFWLLPQTSTTS
jgi:hypothetical protein